MPYKGTFGSLVCCIKCKKEVNTNGLAMHIWRTHGKGIGHKPQKQGRKDRLIRCEKCDFEVKATHFKRHNVKCDGIGPACRTLEKRRKTKPGEKRGGWKGWSKGLTKEDPRIARREVLMHELGHHKAFGERMRKVNKTRIEELREQGRRIGGYREHGGRSKGDYRIDSFGVKTWLQSSYEILCADILTELSITWNRPNALFYELDGKKRRYFPDFYLPDIDVYLDPKNAYLCEDDKPKIELASRQNNVRIEILQFKDLTKEYLRCFSYRGTAATAPAL